MPNQGQMLEVTVLGCDKLKNTETFSRQDPYVLIDYGDRRFRTRTCTDGGKKPTFNQKFVFPPMEGFQEMTVTVMNSNTLFHDKFIASGTIYLQTVLSKGLDNSVWPLQTHNGKCGGEIRLLLKCEKPQRSRESPDAVPPPYPYPPLYHHPPPPPFPYPPPYPYPPSYAQPYGQPPPPYYPPPQPAPPPGYGSAYPPPQPSAPPGYGSSSHAPPTPPHSHHPGYGSPPYY